MKPRLVLYKFGQPQTTNPLGWLPGDYMLTFPGYGDNLPWSVNQAALQQAMDQGQPIADSYIVPGTG